MRFGSVCSGIEAASVAWHPLGWQAAWLAEIEPFPSAVLKHHYSEVPNHGDMTLLPGRIRSGEVEAPDLFCGGTPCQAFSVAGKRQSLEDARGNLSLTFCDIADAIDESRSVRGLPATIVFWENVPGVLSTKDNAFGCFLAQLCGGDEPLHAPDGWPDAGCVSGPRRTAAWRILDAQYFGLAQRRRRVFVVASAREGFDPAAVLFEFNGVRRDTAPSREAGQTTPTLTKECTEVSRPGHNEDGWYVPDRQWPADVACTLNASFGSKQGLEDQHALGVAHLFVPDHQDPVQRREGAADSYTGGVFNVAPIQQSIPNGHIIGTITARMFNSLGPRDVEEGALLPVTYDFFNITAPVNGQNRKPGDPCRTLARSNAEHAVVMQPISIHPHCIGRAPESGPQGKEYLIDGSAYCMDSRGQPQAIAFHPTQTPISSENVRHTISANENATAAVLAPTLTASNDPSRSPQSSEITAQVAAVFEATAAVATGFDAYNNSVTGDIAKTLDVGQDHHDVPLVQQQTAMQVRRLTPTECERLQGFPDGYTAIPWRGKPASECPDGPRYKALGNSWAVPVVRWIGKRIQEHING